MFITVLVQCLYHFSSSLPLFLFNYVFALDVFLFVPCYIFSLIFISAFCPIFLMFVSIYFIGFVNLKDS